MDRQLFKEIKEDIEKILCKLEGGACAESYYLRTHLNGLRSYMSVSGMLSGLENLERRNRFDIFKKEEKYVCIHIAKELNVEYEFDSLKLAQRFCDDPISEKRALMDQKDKSFYQMITW